MTKNPEVIKRKIQKFMGLIEFEAVNIGLYKDVLPSFERRASKRISFYAKRVCALHCALQPKKKIKFAHN